MKRLLLILGMLVLFSGTASAGVIILGDTAAHSSQHLLAKQYPYATLLGACGGSGTVAVDSIMFDFLTYGDGYDTCIISLYLDNGYGTKPTTRVSSDTVIVSKNTSSWEKKLPHAAINLTGGTVYWLSVGSVPLDDGTGGGLAWQAAYTAKTPVNRALGTAFTVGDDPWIGGTSSSTQAPWRIAFWGHDGSSPSSVAKARIPIRSGP